MRKLGMNRYGNPIKRETAADIVETMRRAAAEYRAFRHDIKGGRRRGRAVWILRCAAVRLARVRAGGIGNRTN